MATVPCPPLPLSSQFGPSSVQLLEKIQGDPAKRLDYEIQLQQLLNRGVVLTPDERRVLQSLGYWVSHNQATIARFKDFACPDIPTLEEAVRAAHPRGGLLLDKFKAMRPGPCSVPGGYARGYDEVFAIFGTQTTEKEAHGTQIAGWLKKLGLDHGRLIDVGCGNGGQLKAIAERVPLTSVTAIDNQAGSIEKARTLLGQPTWEFKEMSAFSPLDISPADIILMAHFYCPSEKTNRLLDHLRSCEKRTCLYIFIHSVPQSDTGVLCSNLPFLRPRPAQQMSESFESALKQRRYSYESHIVESVIRFPPLTPALIATLLALPMGGYEDQSPAEADVKVIKALMEFIAGFPLEAFSLEERQLYIDALENLFRSNGGSFLKVCNRIILAHPETASASFVQKFKELHGDLLDTPWPLMMQNYKTAYEQTLSFIHQQKYDQAEDVLTHWLKRLNLFHRNPAGNIGPISLEMAQGYLLLSQILMKKKKYTPALAVVWYAIRIDPLCQEQAHQLIETIEMHYREDFSISSPFQWLTQAQEDRERLDQLRARIDKQLKSLQAPLLTTQLPALRILYQQVTQEMKDFFSHVLQGVEQDLINGGLSPPCPYVVGGLGSFAREEITPYSDLEFIIITRSNEKKDKVYFRIMTTLFHARIINLGETLLPSLDIRSLHWLFDDKTHRGVAFDGSMSTAAKTPHGKQSGGKGDYELIGSIAHFLRFQGNWVEDTPKERRWAAERYHLPTVLSNVVEIKGDKDLLQDYQKALPKATDPSLVLDLLEHDLVTFDPKVSDEGISGKMHNVKKDLYRLPTAILDSLARYFQLTTHSSWERVEELRDRNLFSPEAASDLLHLLTQVQALRLMTYFDQGAQKDDLPEGTDLYPFYFIAIPFVNAVKRFYQAVKQREENSEHHLKTPRFFDNSPFCQGCIARRLLDYRKAEILLEKASPDTPLYFEVLADVKKELYQLEEAAKLYRQLLSQLPEQEKELIATIRIKLAKVCQEQALYVDAQRELAEAEKTIDPSFVAVSEKLSKLRAEFYMDTNNYEDAEAEIDRNLTRIYQRLTHHTRDPRYHVYIDPSLGETLLLKAQIQQEKCQFKEAENSFKEANMIFRGYYQNSKHPKLAHIHLLMGNLLESVDQSEEALANEEQALLIYSAVFHDNHPDIATSYNNMGYSLDKLGRHEEALLKKKEALKVWQALFGETHPNIATSYHNIGISLAGLQQYKEALDNQRRGLSMQINCLGDRHPLVAIGHDGIAGTLGKLNQHESALEHKEKALQIRRALFGESHLDVAKSLYTVAYSLTKLKRYDEAIAKYTEATLIFQKLLGQNSAYLADCYSSRGRAWYELTKYEQAFGDEERTLNIYLTKSTPPYPKIAASYNKLGHCLLKLKKYAEAKQRYAQAQTIFEENVDPDHPEIAKCKAKISHCEKKLNLIQVITNPINGIYRT